jgi:hypothetical protein
MDNFILNKMDDFIINDMLDCIQTIYYKNIFMDIYGMKILHFRCLAYAMKLDEESGMEVDDIIKKYADKISIVKQLIYGIVKLHNHQIIKGICKGAYYEMIKRKVLTKDNYDKLMADSEMISNYIDEYMNRDKKQLLLYFKECKYIFISEKYKNLDDDEDYDDDDDEDKYIYYLDEPEKPNEIKENEKEQKKENTNEKKKNKKVNEKNKKEKKVDIIFENEEEEKEVNIVFEE